MQKTNPIPQGKYVTATRFNNVIYTAGMTPRKNGVLIQSGKVTLDADVESYREAMCQAADNALTAAQNKLAEGEKILIRMQSSTQSITIWPAEEKENESFFYMLLPVRMTES